MTTHKLIALALLLTLLAPTAAATIGPAPSTLASPCTPGAAYDPACDVDHDGDVDVIDVQLAAGHWNQAGVWTGGDYWSLTGNTGTAPGTHFLGTTDNQALAVQVNGSRALLIQPNDSGSHNLIGGYSGNSVSAEVLGATIGGGGGASYINSVSSSYGTVGGGKGNTASGSNATVGGGYDNTASAWGTVGGGYGNTASGEYATVSGGIFNTASESNATVSGGRDNTASAGGTVGGGRDNTASGEYATVSGGIFNTASEPKATVGGGRANFAIAENTTVGGGSGNQAGRDSATVGGGSYNGAYAYYATVPGGKEGVASHYGELAYASGRFAFNGDAQTSLYVLRQETGDAALTELFLDGSAERITLAADRVMTFDILVVGSHRFGGSSAGYQIAGVIRNIGGATAFVGTPIKTVLGENNAAWDVQVEADDGLDALVVKVQGSSGTTIRWVASVRTVEVGR